MKCNVPEPCQVEAIANTQKQLISSWVSHPWWCMEMIQQSLWWADFPPEPKCTRKKKKRHLLSGSTRIMGKLFGANCTAVCSAPPYTFWFNTKKSFGFFAWLRGRISAAVLLDLSELFILTWSLYMGCLRNYKSWLCLSAGQDMTSSCRFFLMSFAASVTSLRQKH